MGRAWCSAANSQIKKRHKKERFLLTPHRGIHNVHIHCSHRHPVGSPALRDPGRGWHTTCDRSKKIKHLSKVKARCRNNV